MKYPYEKPTNRLTILSNSEIRKLYNIQEFNNEQRAFYFSLNDLERREMESFRSIESRMHFILQLGYFKCKRMFFKITFSEVRGDVSYILREHFPNCTISKKIISRNTQLDNKSKILKILNFRLFDKEAKELLENQAIQSIRIVADPRYIFDSLLITLNRSSFSIPGYSTLQEIISKSFSKESERLNSIISTNIPKYIDNELRCLLEISDKRIHGITLLKKDAKGFNHKELMIEIEKKNICNVLYKFATKVMPELNISNKNVCYYASLVDYYTVDRLKELSYETARVYLLCYVFFRFQKINDNLVNSFIYHINSYKKRADEAGKKGVQDQKLVENPYKDELKKVLELYLDESIADQVHFGDVRIEAFTFIPKNIFSIVIKNIDAEKPDETPFKWHHYQKMSKAFCKNLRPLAICIDFESENAKNTTMVALKFIKNTFGKEKHLATIKERFFPKESIHKNIKSFLYVTNVIKEDGKEDKFLTKLSPQRYEFMVYSNVENQLGSGKIIVKDSINFKSFKDDLVNDELWVNKDKVITELNNPLLITPIKKLLEDLREELDPLILKVNERIKSGENKEIKIKENGEWTLPYNKQESEVNNPFYEQLPRISLSSIMNFVNQHCGFMTAFTHIKSRYSKNQADEDAISACITAEATNYGIYHMAEISDIGYNNLLSTSKNFIRLENMKKANDILANGISELPMFRRWNLEDDRLFSSIDGKKCRTRLKNIMARYSTKYFGTDTGVVSYSMISNHVCVNSQIIGANEHESHYLFDTIFNNTSNIQPEWHSGDTHSINRVNFALIHLLGQRFAPHIKDISKKAASICSFENPKKYEGSLIIPKAKINTRLIEDEWDNIQRIYASLLLKETTQSVIVKKLSSYSHSNRTFQALCEFDNILMSLHVLEFIDDPILRRCERIALNRGEAYHQLTGKIASVNGNKFRGTTELELQIANECCRFVANCVIYYNTLILSKIYETQEKLGNTVALEFIRRLSPDGRQLELQVSDN